MAHILVTAMPFAGHVRPMTAVAAALLDRGHRVTAYTGARYAEAFGRLGCAILPWSAAQDFDETRLSETFPDAGGPGPLGLIANVRDVFIGTARGQVDDVCAAHAVTPFDAIVADVLAVGAGLTAELLDLPWATISVVPLSMPSRDLPPSALALAPGRGRFGEARDALLRRAAPTMTAPLDRPHRAVRASLGLGPGRRFDSTLYSPTLVIATGAPSIEFPRTDLPASVHFVGRLVPPTAARPTPSWVAPLLEQGSPLVFVTQGTLTTDPTDLLVPAIVGLADEPVRVVGTTAGRDVGTEPPPNARLVDFVPFAAIVPSCEVGVTNGGWGGVLEMLSMGVPLVVAGGTLDKPQIAAQVAYSGAGVDLRTGRPKPAQVRDAVRKVRTDPRFKQRALEIAAELERLGGARHAAELIERLVLPAPHAESTRWTRDRPPPEEVPPSEEDVIVARRVLVRPG
ncbi:glycosyltransferase [Agrococcus jenensis]|uniref:glycosyltransferase n=1 Tax=Agrococcus jenensis TaxID=46353 RepID=UPI000F4BDE0F|nr:nucleotide disphospho-sugar-binding domain-containing protein [Agrococcus jenensis]